MNKKENAQYHLLSALWWLLSLLPWWFHYLCSDYIVYPLVHFVIKYRRKVVRHDLSMCFPDKTEAERYEIECGYYHWFSDYVIELIKQGSMTSDDVCRHMQFEGVEEAQRDFLESDATLWVVFLGHFANWEWFTSLNCHIDDSIVPSQIYHPLHSKVMDRILLRHRSVCGTENVAMKDTLRFIIGHKREGRKICMGFIADQCPKREAIHHWMQWFGHDTPVITGAETIGKKVGAVFFYADIQPVKRGYYKAVLRKLEAPAPSEPGSDSPYPITEAYMQAMEESIRKNPPLWLWTHRRWKYTREEDLK